MPLSVTCSDCSATYRLKDSAAGKSLICKQCGKVLSIPVSDVTSNRPEAVDAEAAFEWVAQAQAMESASRATAKTPAPPLAPLGQRLFGFVVSLVLHAVMLLVLLPLGFEPIWESVRAGSWPQVDGVIKTSDVKTTYTSKGGARSTVVVSYQYEVSSATYTGRRICVMGHSNKTFENVNDIAARYPVDAKVKVYYDPRDPTAAVLVPGTSGLIWLAVLIAVAMWINLANFTRLTFLALIGKPVPPAAPGTSPLGKWIASTMLVLLAVMFGGMVLMLGSGLIRSFQWPRDFGEWLMAGFALFMFGLLCAFVAFLLLLVLNHFKPAPTVEELKADPSTPFDGTTPRKLGRFVASANGMRVSGGVIGLLAFFALKLFIQTQFIDLLVLVGAGTVLGFLFASRRAK